MQMNALNKLGGRPSRRLSGLLKVGSAVTVVALMVAGCSSGSDKSSTDASNSGATGTAGEAGARHVCAIGGADAFFAVVKNGADLAGKAVKAAGNQYTWIPLPNYDNIGPDMVKLIEQAVAQKCTSLAVP